MKLFSCIESGVRCSSIQENSAVQRAFKLVSSKCQIDSVHTMRCIKAGDVGLK